MPDTLPPRQPLDTVRDANALHAAGLIAASDIAAIDAVQARYAIAIPPALLALISTTADPIGRQFIPHPDELRTAPHETVDPIGDDALSPVKGVVHRYADRVLLKPLLICPTYCRFCFRREHVGPDGGLLTEPELDTAIAYIAARPELREVILTGGDPLMLSPRRLAALLRRLEALPNVELIRIHTRIPVADPARITPAFAAALHTDRAMFVVLHTNHPSELTPHAATALRHLQAQAIPILSQTVLLHRVNDDVDTLESLFRTLLRLRIKPYYLHQLDPAPGTAHFHVPIATGQALMTTLRDRLTGIGLPTYVQDSPTGKRQLG